MSRRVAPSPRSQFAIRREEPSSLVTLKKRYTVASTRREARGTAVGRSFGRVCVRGSTPCRDDNGDERYEGNRFSGGARPQLSHRQRQRAGALLAQPGRGRAAAREDPQAGLRAGLRAANRPRRYTRQAVQPNGERPTLRQVRINARLVIGGELE